MQINDLQDYEKCREFPQNSKTPWLKVNPQKESQIIIGRPDITEPLPIALPSKQFTNLSLLDLPKQEDNASSSPIIAPKAVWRSSKEKTEKTAKTGFHSGDPNKTKVFLRQSSDLVKCQKTLSESLRDNEKLPFDLATGCEQDDFFRSIIGTKEKLQTKTSLADLEGFYSKCLVQAKKQDLVGEQILYLLKLSAIYIGKAKKEMAKEKKEIFLLVGAKVLNCAVILVEKENIVFQDYLFRRLEEIEILFLECQNARVIIKKDEIRDFRNRLSEIRQSAETSHQNGTSIQETLSHMTHSFIRILKDLIEITQELLPPISVKWAAIGMGSMSRGEMCPYSDIEFAFLIEKESQKALDYFRTLSKILELKIINLGETKFPVFGGGFDSPTPDGFCMDNAGNTPLGVPGVYELIGTPEQLAQFQTVKWMERNIILPNAMSNVCLIAGDEGLLKNYSAQKKKVQQLLDTKERIKRKNGEELAMRLLGGHLIEFSPDLSKEKEKESAFGIKKELYRPFQEILGCLSLIYELKEKSTFGRIDELAMLNVFSATGADNLKKAVSAVLSLRLKAHLFYKDEKEFLCHAEEGKNLDPSLYYFDDNTIENLHEIYKVLLPFHQCATEFYRSKNKDLLNKNSFYDERPLVRAKVFEKTCQYTKAIEAYQQAVSLNPNSPSTLFKIGNMEQILGNYQEALQRFLTSLNLLNQKYEGIDAELLHYQLSSVYSNLGDYQKQLEHGQIALTLRLKSYGENDFFLPANYASIGHAYSNLGKYAEALEYYQKDIALSLEIQGQNNTHLASSYDLMGLLYDKMGNYEKALEYLHQSSSIIKSIFQKNHPSMAISFNNLGYVYENMGNYKKAIEYYKMALTIDRALFGEHHPKIAAYYNNIGSVSKKLGETKEALKFYQKALKITMQFFDENHPTIAVKLNNIGNTHADLGEFKEALECLQKALDIQLKTLGENHAVVAQTLNNMASLYDKMGDYDKALELGQKSLTINQQVFGDCHIEVSKIYGNIGGFFINKGRYEVALEFYMKSVTIKKELFGENHITVAYSYNNLGFLYNKNPRQTEKALEFYQKALDIFLNILPENHPDIANCYGNISEAYLTLNNHKEAVKVCEKALEMKLQIWGENHLDVATSYNNLGSCLSVLGKRQESLQCYQKALNIFIQILGEIHTRVAVCHNNIGTVYSAIGKEKKALKSYQKALEIRLLCLEKDHPDIAKCHFNIACCYHFGLKNYSEAMDSYGHCLDIRVKKLDEKHPDLVQTLNLIGRLCEDMDDVGWTG